MALRKTLLYTFSESIPKLGMKIKFPNEALDELFVPESELGYESFTLKKGQTVDYQDFKIRFDNFNVQAQHSAYEREEGDVAVNVRKAVQQVPDVVTVFSSFKILTLTPHWG